MQEVALQMTVEAPALEAGRSRPGTGRCTPSSRGTGEPHHGTSLRGPRATGVALFASLLAPAIPPQGLLFPPAHGDAAPPSVLEALGDAQGMEDRSLTRNGPAFLLPSGLAGHGRCQRRTWRSHRRPHGPSAVARDGSNPR